MKKDVMIYCLLATLIRGVSELSFGGQLAHLLTVEHVLTTLVSASFAAAILPKPSKTTQGD